jgi:hypothetical protein
MSGSPKKRAQAKAPARKQIRFEVDPDQLTLGDLEDFADATGIEFDEARRYVPLIDPETGVQRLSETGKPMFRLKMSARCMTALVWIIERRSNPALTLEQVRSDVTIGDLVFASDPAAAPDPPGASD